MMKKYYLHDGNNQHGPYDLGELKRMFVRPDALVWFNGLTDWMPAGEVDELASLFTPSQNLRSGYTVREAAPTPLPSYSKTTAQADKRKPLIIAGAIAFAVLIVAIIYFTNSKSEAADGSRRDSIENARRLADEQKERERLAALEALAKKQRNYRNNWKKYVTHKTNNYSVGTFGGIDNLKVFATNNTDKILDEVVITVDYYKANGDLFTSKEVTLSNVQPGSITSEEVEDTWRGTTIKTRISRITSKSLEFCYNEEYKGSSGISGDKKDPWLCKG